MVIDSSALLAVYYREDGFEKYEQCLDDSETLLVSAATFVEAWVAVMRRLGRNRAHDFDLLIEQLRIVVVPVDQKQAILARDAYARYGKGQHPAGLNFGDCFSYALAKQRGEPLLFKGNDFSQTDILSAT